jgi:hypothetical protein
MLMSSNSSECRPLIWASDDVNASDTGVDVDDAGVDVDDADVD